MKLTQRQKTILDFIKEFIHQNGYSPSMEEIAVQFQISSLNAVYKHLEALKARGFLKRDANKARSIELPVPAGAGSISLPLLGYVAAGRPIEAVATPDTLSIPEDFLPPRASCYMLRVLGNSMIDEHIEDGDYVIVESRAEARDGEMVVALVDGDNVTLKKLYREGEVVRLQPANPDLPPMRFDPSRIRVQGVVVGVMRKYT